MQDPLLLDLKRDKNPKLLKKQCHTLVWWNCKASQHLTVSGCIYITNLCSTEEAVLWSRAGGTEHPKPTLYESQGFTFTLVHSLRHSTTKGVLRWTIELLSPVQAVWDDSAVHTTAQWAKTNTSSKLKWMYTPSPTKRMFKLHNSHLIQVHYSTIYRTPIPYKKQ